jgi:hypothetical protein
MRAPALFQNELVVVLGGGLEESPSPDEGGLLLSFGGGLVVSLGGGLLVPDAQLPVLLTPSRTNA